MDLFSKWWRETHIIGDFSNSWRLKLQKIRKNLRGWDRNIKAEKIKNKTTYLKDIKYMENIQEERILDEIELERLKFCHIELDKIYDDEEKYWQQRAKLK
jgi:hypothetical protein